MTENEAIRDLDIIRFNQHWDELVKEEYWEELMTMALNALKEIQQYRAIGTVEHIKLTFELCKGLDAMVKMYQAIGTIEEFKALKEEVELYRNLDKTNFSDGYNRAIDEFAEKIQWEYLNSCGLKQREIDFLVAVSSMVAEQMKGSEENG